MHTYHLTQWLLFFFFYSFVGWVWECCYVSARKHRWINRGFMHGPMLPIYGSGAVVILAATLEFRGDPLLVFLFGMAAATVLEYITGAVMERLFHVRYWDYSNQKFNLNGYICASSSLCWGVFSVLLVQVVHVPVERAVLSVPAAVTDGLAIVLTVAASVDFTQSFNEAMDLKHILVQLEESRIQIRKMQEKLRVTSEEVLEDYRQKADEVVAEYRARIESLSKRNHSRKEAYLEWINMKRSQKRLQLEELRDRAEFLMKDELPSRVDELIGPERRESLKALRDNIVKELHKINTRTDRSYLNIASQLRRNPTAASKRFSEALEELREYLEQMK